MTSTETTAGTPRVFMSYSHDSEEHSSWVLTLASRLRANGVDVCLDRWDVTLGGNLALFMERAASADYRVLAVVSATYSTKADAREGGAGVEAQMLSAALYEDLGSDRVIPIIRNNPSQRPVMPAFLSGRLYVDFRDETQHERRYEDLLRNTHGQRIEAAPPLGPNPFVGKTATEAALAIRNDPSRWHDPALDGEVEFVYSQNSGRYEFGTGPLAFTLNLSGRGVRSVYAYRDGRTTNVAVVESVAGRDHLLKDVSQFDTSSRVVQVDVGDAIVLHNRDGYWALVHVLDVFERQSLNRESVIRFHYRIKSDRSQDFRA